MNKFLQAWCFLLVAGVVAVAQEKGRPAEALARWQWQQDLRLPADPNARGCEYYLPAGVLDKARSDLQDLRLFDAAGREVPYAMRIRLERDEMRSFAARAFNPSTNPDRSVEVTLDLGESPSEHNRIEVGTGGVNYRRLLRLDGSDDGKTWKPMIDKRWLSHLSSAGKSFDDREVSYGVSRFRYLRVRVAPDPAVEGDAPSIPEVRVLRTIRVAGLEKPWPAALGPRTPIRDSGAYASEWFIALPGSERVPWSRLEIDAAEDSFTRTYRVETADDLGQTSLHPVVAQGEWNRTSAKRSPLVVVFPSEVPAKRLRLVIVDQRNDPLTIQLVKAAAAARQMIFERPPAAAGPFHLYFGNADATDPGYDYARTLPDEIGAPLHPVEADEVGPNPTYVPPRVPLTERSPALTYAVFGIVAVLLLVILVLLARRAIAQHDAAATS